MTGLGQFRRVHDLGLKSQDSVSRAWSAGLN